MLAYPSYRPVLKVVTGHQGYNCTVFAYGQTGAGKTFTMQGKGFEPGSQAASEERGLQPRVFDYLYAKTKEEMSDNTCEHLIRCSYFEIYNEQIVDLVNSR